MKGVHEVRVESKRVRYRFLLRRNLTFRIYTSRFYDQEKKHELVVTEDSNAGFQFFKNALSDYVMQTQGTYLRYNKRRLNCAYLNKPVAEKILEQIPVNMK